MVQVGGEVVVGDPAREVNAGGEPLFLQGSLDRLFQLPVPTDEHAEVLPVAEDGRESLGEVLDTFFSTKTTNITDAIGSIGKFMGLPKVIMQVKQMAITYDFSGRQVHKANNVRRFYANICSCIEGQQFQYPV